MTDHTNDPGYNANIVHLADFATNAPIRFIDLKDQPPDILRAYGPFRNELFEAAKEYPGTAITLIDRELSDSAQAIWSQPRVDGRKWLLVILDPIGGLRWRDPFYQIVGADVQKMIVSYDDFDDAVWEIGDLQQEEDAKDMILICARHPEEWFLASAAANLTKNTRQLT